MIKDEEFHIVLKVEKNPKTTKSGNLLVGSSKGFSYMDIDGKNYGFNVVIIETGQETDEGADGEDNQKAKA